MQKSVRYTTLTESVAAAMCQCENSQIADRLVNFLRTKSENYLYDEKDQKYYVNSFFPSIPGAAWNRMVNGMDQIANYDKRIPIQADLVVTGKCHCQCWHCFRAKYKSEEMNIEVIKELINELYDLGTVNLGITGGEPMLRNDILDIIDYIPRGMEAQLYTTGHRIDNQFAAKLKQTNLTRCIISLDHFDPVITNRLRNNAHAFEDAVTAIKALVKARIYTSVTVCVTNELLEEGELEKYIQFAANLHVSEIRIVLQIPQGNLAGKQIGRIYGRAACRIKEMQTLYNGRGDYPTIVNFNDLESIRYFGCGAGFNYITINDDGMVTPCVAVPLAFGDSTKERLADIYEMMSGKFPESNIACYGVASGAVIANEEIDIGIPPLSKEQSGWVVERCQMVSKKAAIFTSCKMDEQKLHPQMLQ